MTEPSPPTILVIDDDRGICETVADLLERTNYRVIYETSGKAGVERAAAEQPALILVDAFMPRIDGPETVRRLRADARTRKIPIIALTAAGSEVARTMIAAGCVAYIPKPFDFHELAEVIGRLLRATSGRSVRT